jgi:hypothetical protein
MRLVLRREKERISCHNMKIIYHSSRRSARDVALISAYVVVIIIVMRRD